MNFTLVMSASVKVNPNGLYHISTESLRNREEQYINTLKFYVEQESIKHILFVDNSNADLTRIKHSVNGDSKVEFLSLDLNNYPGKWGKGYGEFLLLDRAVDYLIQSSSSRNSSGEGIIKVTGRFPILNIDYMVKEFSSRNDLSLSVDVVNHPLYDILGIKATGHFCRTIIWASSIPFYRKYIYGEYERSPDKYKGAEHFMMQKWASVKGIKGVYSRFRQEPRLSGYSGAIVGNKLFSGNYDGLKNKCKRCARQVARWLMPWLWI